ncbi:MAG: hypothetical protein Q4G52_07900 [Clostridia bacterium]|nr:hypothetical protein [Clostridia bacterium]
MIIGDKQELRRCLKQAVRRAQVTEERLDFDVAGGEIGVDALMSAAAFSGRNTPFGEDGAAVYAALNALELPAGDLAGARSMAGSFDRGAWLREVLDAMRAKRVLVPVSVERAEAAVYDDDRLSPMIRADASCFPVGRYGVDYESAARRMADAALACGARDICAEGLGEEALRYAVLPACEDCRAVLHIELFGAGQVSVFADMLDAFDGVKAVACAEGEAELSLISQAQTRSGLLVRLSDWAHLDDALAHLGTRFLPYAARAGQPELMLGRWLSAKERLWQALLEAYLPLAKAGYALESERIERDVAMLLTGSVEALYL